MTEEEARKQAATQTAKINAAGARAAANDAQQARDKALREAQKAKDADDPSEIGFHAYQAVTAANAADDAARRAELHNRYAHDAAGWANTDAAEEATGESADAANAARSAANEARRKTAWAEAQQVAVGIATKAKELKEAADGRKDTK